MVGLVCGHLPNRFYTDYLADQSAGRATRVTSVDYRSKEGTSNAADFNFVAMTENGVVGRPLSFFRTVNTPYTYGMFQHNACNYCDCTAPGSLDTRLRYAAWRSSCSSRASIGV